jgi:dolichol-phosphate mannosyltransferase
MEEPAVSVVVPTYRQAEDLRRLYGHRFGGVARVLKFGLVGLSGMVVDLTTLSLLLPLLPLSASRAAAIWAALTWNFWLNRRITFADARRGQPLRQYLLFALSCLFGAVTSWTTSMLLSHAVAYFAAHPLLAAVAGVIGGAGVNYLFCKTAVFRPGPEPGRRAQRGADVPVLPVSIPRE